MASKQKLDIPLVLEKLPPKIKPADHRSKYPELRGLDSNGTEYKKRYSKIWRRLNAAPQIKTKRIL